MISQPQGTSLENGPTYHAKTTFARENREIQFQIHANLNFGISVPAFPFFLARPKPVLLRGREMDGTRGDGQVQ